MVEKVYQNIWKIEVPLPKSPLKFLNAYVIVGDKKNHRLLFSGDHILGRITPNRSVWSL